MLDLQCGDRIELCYQDAPATTMRATVARLLSDCEEGMGVEVEDYTALWIEITLDEPSDMDANQVVLFGTDFQYRLNGRRVAICKRPDWLVRSSLRPAKQEKGARKKRSMAKAILAGALPRRA